MSARIYYFPQKTLTTVILLSGQLYIQALTFRILNLSFQILVEPLARLLDTRKKQYFGFYLIFSSTLGSHRMTYEHVCKAEKEMVQPCKISSC